MALEGRPRGKRLAVETGAGCARLACSPERSQAGQANPSRALGRALRLCPSSQLALLRGLDRTLRVLRQQQPFSDLPCGLSAHGGDIGVVIRVTFRDRRARVVLLPFARLRSARTVPPRPAADSSVVGPNPCARGFQPCRWRAVPQGRAGGRRNRHAVIVRLRHEHGIAADLLRRQHALVGEGGWRMDAL